MEKCFKERHLQLSTSSSSPFLIKSFYAAEANVWTVSCLKYRYADKLSARIWGKPGPNCWPLTELLLKAEFWKTSAAFERKPFTDKWDWKDETKTEIKTDISTQHHTFHWRRSRFTSFLQITPLHWETAAMLSLISDLTFINMDY